jgi:hypothetical protein
MRSITDEDLVARVISYYNQKFYRGNGGGKLILIFNSEIFFKSKKVLYF